MENECPASPFIVSHVRNQMRGVGVDWKGCKDTHRWKRALCCRYVVSSASLPMSARPEDP